MATGPYRIGLNEVEVGLVVPEGIQHLMARVVGHYRAERLVVSGTMLDAAQAHAIGLVDELVDIDHVATRALAWLRELLAKPSQAMLATRAIARADLVDAMTNPARIALDGFIDGWFAAETQAVLQGLVARLKK
jgi:enoyl-CoA hydratase/carnithine racemase